VSVPRNTVLAFLPQAATLVTGVVTSIVTARYLGAAGRGVLALALLALGVLLLVADLGVSAAITYFVSRGSLNRNQALRFSTFAALSLGSLAWFASLALYPVLRSNVLGGVSPGVYAVALASVLPMLFVAFWTRLRQALGDFAATARMQTSVALGTMALTVAVLPVARQGVFELMASLVVLHTVLAAGAFSSELRAAGFARRLPEGFVRQAASYGLRSYVGGLVSYAALRLDAFVLNAYAGNAAVGRYTVAVTLGEKLWLIDSSLQYATMPEVVAREREHAADLVARANRMVLLATGTGAALLFAIATPLIGLLYGADFLDAATPLRILLPGVVMYASGRTLLQYHIGQLGRPGAASSVMGASAVLGLVLYLVLIPRYGLTGAAWASTVAYGFVLAAALVLFLRDSHLGLAETMVVRGADARRLLQLVRDALARVISSISSSRR